MYRPAGCQTSLCGEPHSKDKNNFWQIFFLNVGHPAYTYIFCAIPVYAESLTFICYQLLADFFFMRGAQGAENGKNWFYIIWLKL